MVEILVRLRAGVDTHPVASGLHKGRIMVKEGHSHLIIPRLLNIAEEAMKAAAKRMDEELDDATD